jgi:hypothetical protein
MTASATMRRAACAAAFALLPLAAAALPERIELPLAPVLAHPATQEALDGITVRFGRAADAPAASAAELRVVSWARPTDTRNFGGPRSQLADGRTVPLTLEQTCELALRYTLGNLADAARARGAAAVVDVVSDYERSRFNSTTHFECIPGRASSSVYLRGRADGAR